MNELWTYTVNGSHEAMSAVEPPDDAYDEGSLTRWHSQDELTKLKQQRDMLLEALKKIERMPWPDSSSPYALIAREAIAAVEEEK